MISNNLQPQRVFYFFEKLSSLPHGSGNMKKIATFCEDFAKENGLKYIRDDADNVIIFKEATPSHKNCEPIILQGHLDMVCQKTPDCNIDFLNDGLSLYVDGDFLKARDTTLGGDNDIAVAMVLAILESDTIQHPPIEAVFTTDEEVGMLGALALDTSVLHGKSMINLDSETENIVTVSCAGGADFNVKIPLKTTQTFGNLVTIDIKGLQGGHSGVEIDKNRVNANMIAGRLLNELADFEIVSINGGDKANAIPNRCVVELCVKDFDAFYSCATEALRVIKNEICDREENFCFDIIDGGSAQLSVFEKDIKNKLIYTLLCVPNGITEMSADIDGLVQTSLNLGILATDSQYVILHFALRSNKMSALSFLEKRLCTFFDMLDLPYKTFGHYPAWEYLENSSLRDTYCNCYKNVFNEDPTILAIHAGLECGVFASKIENFDCIAVGPNLFDVHTTRERLSISSTERIYNLLVEVLKFIR